MFKFDSKVKIEALNFTTMMNVIKCSEKKLEDKFEQFAEYYSTSEEMSEQVAKNYAQFFDVSHDDILVEYNKAKSLFCELDEKDEIIKRGSDDYPICLENTNEAPRYLYLRGNKSLLYDTRTVAIVGSRQASESAIINTVRITGELVKNGITIISGLAKGIDVNAHKTALNYGYNTIAVIGTGLNKYYPAENRPVQIEIEKRGLVVSQFSPATPVNRFNFPLRNGVMSGLSLATVIMEAGETSGALKQADYAIKQKRLVIIPQKALDNDLITWPKKYVLKGAKVAKTPKDVLHLLAEYKIYQISEPEFSQLGLNDIFNTKSELERGSDFSNVLLEKK